METESERLSRYFVIVATTEEFKDSFRMSWQRLIGADAFRINLRSHDDEEPAKLGRKAG